MTEIGRRGTHASHSFHNQMSEWVTHGLKSALTQYEQSLEAKNDGEFQHAIDAGLINECAQTVI